MAETTSAVDLAIYRNLDGNGPCTFDELVSRLSTYSWAQVFSAVDRLSREGTIFGQPHARRRLRDIQSGGLLPFPSLRTTESAKRHDLR